MALDYRGFSQTDFARSATTVLTKHIREQESAMLRNYAMGALLDAAGRISYNNGGRGLDWEVQYRIYDVETNTGETNRNFARKNLWKVANLEYRGYKASDQMFYKEMLEGQGDEAITRVFDKLTSNLVVSLKQKLGPQYYVDGNLAANAEAWHGLESLFGTVTQTLNITTGAARTANAADKIGAPTATYAGISTVLGNYGGENESGQSWPNGIANEEFDFWSPIDVNYTSSSFGGATKTFDAQGDEAMRYAITHAMRNTSLDGQITNVWLSRDKYIDFKNLLDDKERIIISSEHSLRAMGFKNVIGFDGIEVSSENAVPTGVGYGMNFNNVELLSMDDDLFRTEGPEYDIYTQSFNAVVSTLSNLKFNSPRNCFKLQAIA